MTSENIPTREKHHTVKLPRHRQRALARWLYNHHKPAPAPAPPVNPVTVVCVSDTHNHQPAPPPGDVLVHAGDLTEWGTFTELRAQLAWLAAQPHRHKVVIAGNHDVLLDDEFVARHPEYHRHAPDSAPYAAVAPAANGDEQTEMAAKTMADLSFGDCVYLRDESTTLTLAAPTASPSRTGGSPSTRTLTVYGSPTTPSYGISAFQAARSHDTWTNRVPAATDILVAHGPAYGHLDGALRAGDAHLAREVARARPRLVVCGHIHVGFGREDVVLDRVRGLYEAIQGGWGGWAALAAMAARVALGRAGLAGGGEGRVTTFVNAAVVGGRGNELVNEPVVVVI